MSNKKLFDRLSQPKNRNLPNLFPSFDTTSNPTRRPKPTAHHVPSSRGKETTLPPINDRKVEKNSSSFTILSPRNATTANSTTSVQRSRLSDSRLTIPPPIRKRVSSTSKKDLKSSSSSPRNSQIVKKESTGCLLTNTQSTSSSTIISKLGSKRPLCISCKAIAKVACGGCKALLYCSKAHQQAHWKSHKAECRMFSIPSQFPGGWNFPSSADSKDESEVLKTWMCSTTKISPATILCMDSPLLVFPKFCKVTDMKTNKKSKRCFRCYKDINQYCSSECLKECAKCKLQLCSKCLQMDDDKSLKSLFQFHHCEEECELLAAFRLKTDEKSKTDITESDWHHDDTMMRDLIIFRILLWTKLDQLKWDTISSLRGNTRFQQSLRRHDTPTLQIWLSYSEIYPISDFFYKNYYNRDKNIKVMDVARIVGLFSQTLECDPRFQTMYALTPWICHSCENPNVELITGPDSTIVIKAVTLIPPNTKIMVNQLTNFDGGTSKASVRLMKEAGIFCANNRCSCRLGQIDLSVALNCSFVNETHYMRPICPGSFGPWVEAPDPQKTNLGFNHYTPAKKWECDTCTFACKFSTIQETYKRAMTEAENEALLLQGEEITRGLQVLKSMEVKLSPGHWLIVKTRNSILKVLNEKVGVGSNVLTSAFQCLNREKGKDSYVQLLHDKLFLYGQDYDNMESKDSGSCSIEQLAKKYLVNNSSDGLLSVVTKRFGKYSRVVGSYMIDLFYTKFAIFINQYKIECQRLGRDPREHKATINSTLSHWRSILSLLENGILCFKNSPVESDLEEFQKASAVFKSFQYVYENCVKDTSKIFCYMNEFLEVFSFQDASFLSTCLVKSEEQVEIEDDERKQNSLMLSKLLDTKPVPTDLRMLGDKFWKTSVEDVYSNLEKDNLFDEPISSRNGSEITSDDDDGFDALEKLSDLLFADEDYLLQMPSDIFEALLLGNRGYKT